MKTLFRTCAAALAACGALLVPAPLSAQDTRAAVIAGQQADKAGALSPEGPNRAEALIVRASALVLGGPPVGPYPWFGSALDGQGFAVGGGYRRPVGDHLVFGAVAGVSVRRATLLEARADWLRLAGGRVDVAAVARRVRAPSVAFFGIGSDSDAEARTSYAFEPTSASLDVTARPHGLFAVGTGYERLALGQPGDDGTLPGFAAGDTPGVAEALGYHVARAHAGLDWRPSPGYSTRGGFVRAAWSLHHETQGRPYGFSQREIEAAQLVPLVGEHIVLAFHALGTFTDPRAGDQVPFVLTPALGSGTTLRGFSNRRFRDLNRLLFTAEYRWRPSRYLDMAIFVDRGQVAPVLEAFRWKDFEQSVGIGARFHGPTFNILRIELARSREGLALAFSTTQPF